MLTEAAVVYSVHKFFAHNSGVKKHSGCYLDIAKGVKLPLHFQLSSEHY